MEIVVENTIMTLLKKRSTWDRRFLQNLQHVAPLNPFQVSTVGGPLDSTRTR